MALKRDSNTSAVGCLGQMGAQIVEIWRNSGRMH